MASFGGYWRCLVFKSGDISSFRSVSVRVLRGGLYVGVHGALEG